MKKEKEKNQEKTKQLGIKLCKDFYNKYNLTPGTMNSQLYKLKIFTKEQKEISNECNKLIHISKLFGGQTKFYELSGLIKKNRKWIKI